MDRNERGRFGRAGNWSGLEGERFAGQVLKRAIPYRGPGADFVMPGRKPVYIEVKSTFGKRPEKKIILKTAGGAWTNRRADHVMIVTNTHVYFGKADALRKHVSRHFDEFKKLPARGREKVVRISVPIAHLEQHGVINGLERERVDGIALEARKLSPAKTLHAYEEIVKRARKVELAVGKRLKKNAPVKKIVYPLRIPKPR